MDSCNDAMFCHPDRCVKVRLFEVFVVNSYNFSLNSNSGNHQIIKCKYAMRLRNFLNFIFIFFEYGFTGYLQIVVTCYHHWVMFGVHNYLKYTT